jgi:hypothetical protein
VCRISFDAATAVAATLWMGYRQRKAASRGTNIKKKFKILSFASKNKIK